MKLKSLVMHNPGVDSLALLEDNSRRPQSARSPETQAGSLSTACLKMDMTGTREIRQVLGLWPSMRDEWKVFLRNANDLAEVGLADSTLSVGKPHTWGSGGAGNTLTRDTLSALRGGER